MRQAAALPEDVLEFWFSGLSRSRWFNSTPEHDREIRRRFERLWIQAHDGQLTGWEETAEGVLALVILLDQMPLNMFRDCPESFASEAQSRAVAGHAIARGLDTLMSKEQKAFLYLPYMHSESLDDQERSVELFEKAGLEDNLKWARHHRDIVRRFGRFPHRNSILGRESTAEEADWLASAEAYRP